MVADMIVVQETTARVAAEMALRAFLANMSHEIRTPMNAVLGYAVAVTAH